MYARPQTTPITQYYEGRLYMKAPFASRPKDLVSLVGYYQVNSPYLVDNLNTLNAVGTYGKPETWSATVGYLANLRPGRLPHPRPQLHGESFAGILFWSFAGKPIPALRRKCIELPGELFSQRSRSTQRLMFTLLVEKESVGRRFPC